MSLHTLSGKLKQSCSDLYQSGVTHSGVFRLDMDGSGPLPPAYVQCHMGVRLGKGEGVGKESVGRSYGVTRVEHNLLPGTIVRGPKLHDMKKVLKYR